MIGVYIFFLKLYKHPINKRLQTNIIINNLTCKLILTLLLSKQYNL